MTKEGARGAQDRFKDERRSVAAAQVSKVEDDAKAAKGPAVAEGPAVEDAL